MQTIVEKELFLTLGKDESDVEVMATAECVFERVKIAQSYADSHPGYSDYDLLEVVVTDAGDSEFKTGDRIELTDSQYDRVKEVLWEEFMENHE